MTSLKKKVVGSLIASYVSQFATSAGNLLIKLVLARLILPEKWGIYAEAMLIVLVADTFTDIGLSQHLMREKHRPYGNVLLIRAILSFIAVGLIVAFADYLSFLGPEVVRPVRALAPLIFIRAISSVPRVYLDRELVVYRTLLPQVAGIFAMGITSLWLAYAGYGVYALIIGAIAQEIATGVLMWRAALGHIDLEWTLRYSGSLIRGSRYLFLIAVVGFLLQQADIAITGSILSPAKVGLYSMALTIVVMTSKLVETAIYRVLYPLFCQYSDRLSVLGRIYETATIVKLAVECPIYFYFLFNSQFLVLSLMGEKWLPMAGVLSILALTGIVNPFGTFGIEVFRATRRDGLLTLTSVVGALTLVTIGPLLTLKYGLEGMVVTRFVAIDAMITVVALYRIIPAQIRALVPKLVLIYGLSLGLAAFARYSVPIGLELRNIMSAFVVVFTWGLFYIFFGGKLLRETFSALDRQ